MVKSFVLVVLVLLLSAALALLSYHFHYLAIQQARNEQLAMRLIGGYRIHRSYTLWSNACLVASVIGFVISLATAIGLLRKNLRSSLLQITIEQTGAYVTKEQGLLLQLRGRIAT